MQTDPIGYEDGMNWYAYVGNDPINVIDPDGNEGVAIMEEIDLFIKSFGYDSKKEGNNNIGADSAAAVSQIASDVGNSAVDIAVVTATVTGQVAAESLAPAAFVTALVPGGQGISAGLTAADVIVNGGVSEALGAGSGAATSLIVADALTNSGNSSGNFKTRALSAVASLFVSDAVNEFIKPAEEKVMGKL